MRASILALLWVCGAIAPIRAETRPNAAGQPAIGTQVDDFTARDSLGTNHSLLRDARGRIVVLGFLRVDCPLARLYAPRLGELARKYEAKGVVFFGVDPDRLDSLTAITAFAKRGQIGFPILKDLRQRIAIQVGVKRTPEVVVLDRERRIRYRGRIDDQFGFVRANPTAGYRRVSVEHRNLEEAIDDLLANKAVSAPETDVAGCLLGHDSEPDAHSSVNYTKDVARILNKSCVTCHRSGQIGPFPLTNYEEAAGWADMIAEVTELRRMPPWHADPKYGKFTNDALLSDADRRTLAQWAAAGAPEGNRKDLPKPPKFVDQWSIPTPDETISMPEPFEVPATGVVELQNFVVDPGWSEDRWISAIEVRPGNPAIVHHILIFVVPPEGGATALRSDDCFLSAYAAGLRPEALPPGYARSVKAGSKLVFNMHYTPNGAPQKDRSYVGVKFADPRSVRRRVLMCGAINSDFTIPPRSPEYVVRSSYAFRQDSLLLSLGPHMHLRGKDFLYEAMYPNGRHEVLLSVPRYDFGWQTMYWLVTPKLMPRGTVLNCVAHFDNSDANPNNPDPSVSVRFGWQSFEEMMVGFFEMTPAQEGLTSENSWTLASRIPFSADKILAAALTTVNISIVSVIVLRMIRARQSRPR